ncbi:DNA-O6-methylguanine--protein-cysteine S-methyltransferase /Transcriptional regulator Ada [Mucilaginibacter lappiensis]|uniref:AraC family transcriptional regulator of adaptative response/methylated-DNA-[protein]-cysteine methyltransferase n=1 Tax=Mucilaginibacter lappiensis TaxID=354630 RepID=A0ABR6PDD9_9SPHI|nr:methylated-DNA--[protein]-cysteine S-methyltransferase [Mucilaginibacter lappiensis]MBB6107754.1 AraC family transcriptional regulator of adaptative response/methylated-DNA-[protein]-cysteine methyltransferase [Mucilaginibacter lappiensis]SIP98170.1 DNA-O6-methylguanine--protein-cysteine S-methyltransferase /Transcriptional regulator Ada [Mucilaginibacter lappiensis]
MTRDLTVNYYRIEKAISYMTANFKQQPDLDEVAEKINLSPFHFQRIFLDWVGLTPKKFLQYLTLDYLKNSIHQTQNVIEAANLAGLSSQSRVYDLFVNIEGVSPQQFKSAGVGLEIFYGYHASPFGICFIAITDRGICDLHFIDENSDRKEYEVFSKKWSFAQLNHRPDITQSYIQKIFKPGENAQEKLNLLVQGTDFQVKVWEALVNIPFGVVRSYQQVAAQLGYANGIRSVASAAGKNPILYLIPCHRIISKDGTVGDFQYGKVRKRTMIAWEMASLAV